MPDYPSIDLHGLFADEACDRVELAIKDALATGHYKLRIVHGKGSGILRREIRALLDRHPQVRTYQNASPHDGGDGATVAALGSRY
ncbi:MAG: Smr/MutS family protein [Chloroflexota bacterium]